MAKSVHAGAQASPRRLTGRALLPARRGAKLLFGDQTLFCRAADFARVGGYDGALPIMEDADLCIRLHAAGPGSRSARVCGLGFAVEP